MATVSAPSAVQELIGDVVPADAGKLPEQNERAPLTNRYPQPEDYTVLRNMLTVHGFRPKLTRIFNEVDLLRIPDSRRTPASLSLQAQGIARGIPAILVSGVNRSGTVYMRNLISKKLDIPIHSITIPMVEQDVVPGWVLQFATGGNVCCEHIYPEYIDRLLANGIKKIVVHWRDPRQWAVSIAIHRNRAIRIDQDPHDTAVYPQLIGLSLAETIDFHIEHIVPSMIRRLVDWVEIAKTQHDLIDVMFTCYEEFAHDNGLYFQRLADFFGYDWSEILSDEDIPRDAQLSNANFRRGSTDEWKSVLSAGQRSQIEAMIPRELADRFHWQ